MANVVMYVSHRAINYTSKPTPIIILLLFVPGSVHIIPLSVFRNNTIMMVVVAHMLSQLLNATFAMKFIVSTDGLFTRRNVCILPEAQ